MQEIVKGGLAQAQTQRLCMRVFEQYKTAVKMEEEKRSKPDANKIQYYLQKYKLNERVSEGVRACVRETVAAKEHSQCNP